MQISELMDSPITKLNKGVFLVASPEISSGLFFKSVILVCEHNLNGSFGLIINRGLDISFPEEMIQLNASDHDHVKISAGGPLQTNQLMVLHNSADNPEQTMNITKEIYLGGDLPFLQSLIQSPYEETKLCLCFGYAGWGAGQLESEILDNRWFIAPFQEDLLFSTEFTKIWKTLLRRMGGHYAPLSMIPDDLSLN